MEGVAGSTFGAGSLSVTISDGIAGDEIVFASGYSLPTGVTFTGGAGNTPLVVSFDADTTLAEVDGLIAAIRYRSTSDNPTQNGTDNTRLYTVVLNDGNNVQTGGNAGGPAALCPLAVNGRFPFVPGSSLETPLDDFAKLFAPGGLIDGFFNTKILLEALPYLMQGLGMTLLLCVMN